MAKEVRIYLGSDHAGFKVKEIFIYLLVPGIVVIHFSLKKTTSAKIFLQNFSCS